MFGVERRIDVTGQDRGRGLGSGVRAKDRARETDPRRWVFNDDAIGFNGERSSCCQECADGKVTGGFQAGSRLYGGQCFRRGKAGEAQG